jgi:GntR family transcriptional repressor for pyruvate dehydrogenase complex
MTTQGQTRFITRDELARELENEIVAGAYPVGSKLPSERRLSDRYGVSRPVVREALRSLVERRLVEIHPGRGAFVRGAQSSDAASQMGVFFRRKQVTARDLVEARSMLECTAAGLAAQRAEPADIDFMNQALARLEQAVDVVDQAGFDLAFHYAVTRAARNPVVESMFAAVAQSMVELMLRSLIDPDVRSEALILHYEIVAAIGARDPEGAREAMARHIEVAERYYGDDLDRSVETLARRELARRLAPSVTLEDVLARAFSGSGLLSNPNGDLDGGVT